ncbi:mucin-3A isoform X2 [Teleopsis dalmanni]|uniref:mucin-3A isoform X2 n=1 Tax=Teleopsis dalmanni TaxID=139649 RepID=UPI0018CEA655|nr:mucin-3A isoform X2 [Teleopsis dalmanni]
MSTNDPNIGPGGPGIGVTGNTGGVSGVSTAAAEPFKIIKNQVIQQQTQQNSQIPPRINTHNYPASPVHKTYLPFQSQIQLKNFQNSFNSVAAKLTHVKTAAIDSGSGTLVSGITIGGVSGGGSGMLASGVSSAGAIKVAPAGTVNSSIVTPIGMNASQSTTAIRAIGTGGQSTQVRVVMPSAIMPPTMIKQFESVATGRTQITAIPAAAARNAANTSITVTRPGTQTTYLPRAGVSATQITGMGVTTGQRVITPIRTAPVAGATVTGLTAAGNFVRGTAVSKNSSPATTVISPATSTTWMAANNSGQVQLIRAIPHQPRQRIITTQGINNAAVGTGVSGSNTLVASSATVAPTSVGQIQGQQNQSVATNIQTVQPQPVPHSQQQQTYVATLATVLPSRQHQATLVYSSSQPLSQPQAYSQSVATGQRFAVASSLANAATGQRQVRPIPLGKSFSTTKLNTTSISIRPPSLPQLAPSIGTAVSNTNVSTAAMASNSPRSTTVAGVLASTATVIPTTNLSSTRIIQLQQQSAQQLLGPAGRLTGNVMLQPIIVNASNNKIGIRPSVTMAAKSQPSLTITQLGIGKLPGAVSANNVGPQNITANIQTIVNNGGASPSTTTSNVSVPNLSSSANTQLVNVSQAQILTTQNICSSAPTVVPLAITRTQTAGGIISGTIPIKNANTVTVGKVMTQAQVNAANNDANLPASVTTWHAAAASARPHSGSNTGVPASSTTPTSSIMTATNAMLSSTVASGTSTFLPPGSTIYYESVPANSVQVSTGVLSLTTTTVTSSTVSHTSVGSTQSTLPISSIPFVSNSANSTATFTVVPSNARNLSQLQIPVSSTTGSMQSMPVRFNAQLSASSVGHAATEAITVSQPTTQLVQGAAVNTGQQIIIPAPHAVQTSGPITGQAPQHMVIPLPTSIKVTSGVNTGGTVVSNFLRKREADGSPIRAAKNLGPTLLSMSSNATTLNSPIVPSVGNSLNVSVATTSSNTTPLTVEALAKKEGSNVRVNRADSPASSDGSTTVSANSSPGVEQQMADVNIILNPTSVANDSTHFNPINDLYPNHHSVVNQSNAGSTPVSSRNSSVDQQQNYAPSQRTNGNVLDHPRKKLRRSTNDSQQSSQSQTSLSLPPPTSAAMVRTNTTLTEDTLAPSATNGTLLPAPSYEEHSVVLNNNHKVNNVPPATGNKENTKPVEYILRRPRNCTLLHTYKQTWKSANNHFQRHSDVKPREERRPTVIDLANQTNVQGKINGWKIHHLRSQMEDLCENESNGYDKLAEMLQQMETHETSPELERINELLKGNMQRSKIIIDGLTDAQSQIMKIFEHKSHVSDIINRCASKRNFKKREKV